MYDFSVILKVSAGILKGNENCRFPTGDVKFIQRFYASFMEYSNYYSSILKISTDISKENVYLVRNTYNLPAIFCKGFLLIFFSWVYYVRKTL